MSFVTSINKNIFYNKISYQILLIKIKIRQKFKLSSKLNLIQNLDLGKLSIIKTI